jgi:hypothetical protein
VGLKYLQAAMLFKRCSGFFVFYYFLSLLNLSLLFGFTPGIGTLYVRDASGNVMSTYECENIANIAENMQLFQKRNPYLW